MSRQPTLRYRCPTAHGSPQPGNIIMGDGPRVRRAYRVLGAHKISNVMPMLGFSRWLIAVEPMGIAAGREAVAEGARRWTLKWDARSKQRGWVQ